MMGYDMYIIELFCKRSTLISIYDAQMVYVSVHYCPLKCNTQIYVGGIFFVLTYISQY